MKKPIIKNVFKTHTKIKRLTASVLLMMGLVSSHVHAENLVGVTSKVSTLGLGGEFTMALGSKAELMAGVNLFDMGFGISEGQMDYDGTLYLNTLYTGLRYHPWANGLYVGGGVALNNNQIKLKPKAKDGKYEFNDVKYDAEAVGSVKTTGTFFKVSPMLLLGWESKNVTEKGMSFFGELGVLISTPPSFEEPNALCSQISGSSCDQVKRDFRVEQEKVEEKLVPTLAYPILGAGVRYRF